MKQFPFRTLLLVMLIAALLLPACGVAPTPDVLVFNAPGQRIVTASSEDKLDAGTFNSGKLVGQCFKEGPAFMTWRTDFDRTVDGEAMNFKVIGDPGSSTKEVSIRAGLDKKVIATATFNADSGKFSADGKAIESKTLDSFAKNEKLADMIKTAQSQWNLIKDSYTCTTK